MLAADLIGAHARPVRALLLDKTDAANWSLGWHQDCTIEPAARVDVPGFGPWTRKQGRLHVAPPIAITERMVTARIHIDPVDIDNAPLLVATGSHRLGYIEEAEIAAVVEQCGRCTCLADAGAIWFYATAVLHASGAPHRVAAAGCSSWISPPIRCRASLPGQSTRWEIAVLRRRPAASIRAMIAHPSMSALLPLILLTDSVFPGFRGTFASFSSPARPRLRRTACSPKPAA